ncbi:MAG: pentapeptide repeat-containing protein [Candidatus Aureabacteria bacterium]|nr:pentapeptide repeat-containing protein [Candidatus Auribacterota bacterium]
MENKNIKLIQNALENHKPLTELRLSRDFKNISLSGCTLQGLRFKGAEFISSIITQVVFIHCDFTDCLFEKTQMEGCRFEQCQMNYSVFYQTRQDQGNYTNCQFSGTSFEDSSFQDVIFEKCGITSLDSFNCILKKVTIKNGEIKNSIFFKTQWNDSNWIENNLSNLQTIKSVYHATHFIKNHLSQAIFKSCEFHDLDWKENQQTKNRMIKCTGIPSEILHEVILTGGQTETFLRRFFRNKICLSVTILVLISLSYILFRISFTSQYLYARYIIRESLTDMKRLYLSKEMAALMKITFSQKNIIPQLNQALIDKRNKFFPEAKKLFMSCLKQVPVSPSDNLLFFWLVNEIFICSEKDQDWMQSFHVFKRLLPSSMHQQLRYDVITKIERKFLPETTLAVLQEYLLELKNDYQKMEQVVTFMNGLHYLPFRKKAGRMIRSFLRRKINEYPQDREKYQRLKEIVEFWNETL